MNATITTSDIMARNLICFEPDTSMLEIVTTMQEKKISSVIIVTDEKAVGIITERDIVKAALNPEENLSKVASELMNSPIVSIHKNIDYRDAYMWMLENKIRHLVVVDDDESLLGMISESDFLHHLSPEQLLAIKEVSKVMSKKVLTCNALSSVASVLELMNSKKISGVVVEEDQKAVGIISERDALKLIQQNSETLQKPVRDFMSSPVVSIHKNQTVLNAQSLMDELHVRRLVVVDDNENIAGIVTRHDLIKNVPEYYVEMLREMLNRQKRLITQTQKKLDEKSIFQNAMKSLPHTLVFATDHEGLIQYTNIKDNGLCELPAVHVHDRIDSLEHPIFELLLGSWKGRVKNGENLHKIIKIANKHMGHSYFHTSISVINSAQNDFEGYMFIASDISTQQTLEQQLQRVGQKLQEAYHIAHIGNWEVDATTLKTFWSNEICDLLGIEHTTEAGLQTLKTFVSTEDLKKIEDSLRAALQTGSPHELIYQVFPANRDEPIWVECRARREVDEKGVAKSLVGTLQNVTERITSQQRIEHLNNLLKSIRNVNQLIVKEQNLQRLLQAICDEVITVRNFNGMWILIQDQKSSLYSAGFESDALREFNNSIAQEILPQCCYSKDTIKVYNNASIDCPLCPLSKSCEKAITVTVPVVFKETYYGHIGIALNTDITQDDEEKTLIQEMANDIAYSIYTSHEREKHEKEHRRYQSLIEHSNDAIFMRTLEGVILDVNPAMEKIHDCPKSEIIGRNVMDFYPPDKHDIAKDYFKTLLEKGSVSFEMEHLKIDGSFFHADLVLSLVEFDGETVVQGSLRDVTKRFEAEKKAREEEEKFKRIFEDSPIGIIYYDTQGTLVTCNRIFAEAFQSDCDSLSGLPLFETVKDTQLLQAFKDALTTGNGSFEGWYRSVTTSYEGYGRAVFKGIRDPDGSIRHAIGLVSDLSEQKKAEDELRLFKRSVEASTEGVLITNAKSIIVDVNDAFENITGYKREDVVGATPVLLKSGHHNKAYYQAMWKSILQEGSWKGEIWNRRKSGEIYPQWLNISSVKNTEGVIENYIAVFSDITSLKESEAKLDFMAHHDHLTELPNRVLLKARLQHTLSVAKRHNTLTSVMFLDLDNFKNINDSYGHSVGDDVIVAVAKRISKLLREDDTLARIGGDEFIIVMNNFSSSEQIGHVAQNIMESFETPYLIENKEFWITASIGISIAPDDGNSAETLIKNADTAMYEAKGDGKNVYKYYNDKMTANSFERILFETALKTAISNHEFEVYYQPQENIQDNSIIGFEALLRWKHPTLGLVSPDRFIPIAEESKMILPIGEFVLNQACKDIAQWHKEDLCKGRIAVNVSGTQLEHSEFSDILKAALKHHNIDPSMIEVEVTESMVMKNPERWIRLLEEIKRIGVAISIDDFGTGYSSLNYLRRLPVDTLKIDRSFIQDIPREKDACAIADAIIRMAESLSLKTLAEGVETPEQRTYLAQKGCTESQGYLLSRPMCGKDTYAWLKARKH
jgi:diguanylate cyclase (GGDEF)-like protein/PAS domain S-box-containing protein